MRTLPLTFFCTLVLVLTSYAQEKQRNSKFLKFTGQWGGVLQATDFLKGDNSTGEPYSSYYGGRLEWGKNTDGRRLWEQLYNYPSFGVGFYTLDFLDGSGELGQPNALYGFFMGPFKRWGKLAFNYDLGFGLSYNWNPYSKDLNPLNTAIGSHNNVYIDAGLNLAYPLGKHFDAEVGFSFSHFSNGASSVPNAGVNLMGLKFALMYRFLPERPEFIEVEIPEYEKENEFSVYWAVGSRNIKYDTTDADQNERYYDRNYFMSNLVLTASRQFTYKSKFGGGMEVTYDGSANDQSFVTDPPNHQEIPVSQRFGLGVFVAYELVISDLSVLLSPGYQIAGGNYTGAADKFYQRMGVKYHFLPNWFGGIYIRATNFSVAHYIEWNVGYRMRW